MKKIRLLVIDDNAVFVKMMKRHFSKNKKVEIVLVAKNGEEGLNLIKNNYDDFDIIILDVIMPIKDGMDVLAEMKENDLNKKVIMLTTFAKETIVKEALSYDVDYFLVKPLELSKLERRIIKCFNEGTTVSYFDEDLDNSITTTLHQLGMPSHIKGYKYIKEGIFLVLENDVQINIYKVYASLEATFITSVKAIERAIRHAIDTSWDRANWTVMEKIFGNSISLDKGKPSNSEYIITIADSLRLESKNRN